MRRALFLAPLAAALLLAGCADWHWYRQDGKEQEAPVAPKPKPKPAPKSATASTPASAPTPEPAPTPAPKPTRVSPSSQSLDHSVVGHWRRPGDASCAAGPEIANDHGKLVITIDGQKSIHKLEGMNSRRILTQVIEPEGGPRYRLRAVKGGGEGARPFTLEVQNRATGGTVTWTPCSLT
ncbi:MAG: hypothetical protein ABI740_04525 [Alphaproteobacteria bacterium]